VATIGGSKRIERGTLHEMIENSFRNGHMSFLLRRIPGPTTRAPLFERIFDLFKEEKESLNTCSGRDAGKQAFKRQRGNLKCCNESNEFEWCRDD
jgi:hypothetical protein